MKLTIDEQNDAIREQVGAELPRPIGGFESSDREDAFRATQDARFLELCATEVRAAKSWGDAAAAADDAWLEAEAEAAAWVEAEAEARAAEAREARADA